MLLSKNEIRKIVESYSICPTPITLTQNLQAISLISTSINITLDGNYVLGML